MIKFFGGLISTASGFFVGWKLYLAIGLVAALAIGTPIVLLKIRSAELAAAIAQKAVIQASLDQQVQVNADNLVELAEIKRRFTIGMAVVAAQRDAAIARSKTLQTIRERISNAPAADDAPLAPVLLDAIRGLHELTDGPAGQDPGRASGSAGGAAPLPGKPPGP